MLAERPPSHSEHRLRSALHRSQSSSAPRHRHSHTSGAAARPVTLSADLDDDLSRAAFLYRTAATASSPIHPPTSYSRPISPSPSHHDDSDPRTMPRRKTSSLGGDDPSCPLSRARLERVLRNGRVVEGRSRSREPSRRDSDSSTTGWPWSDNHSTSAAKRPKSSTSSETSQCPRDYLSSYPSSPPCPTHVRSRSKTDSALPQPYSGYPRKTATYSPSTTTLTKSPSRAHPSPRRNDSSSSGLTVFTPPLTADASPVLNNTHQQHHQEAYVDPDDMRLLTPPPTPPLLSSPYMHPHKRRQIDVGSVERLDLNIAAPASATPTTSTFNARKASETCRRMEGYVSFAAVEGLGMPPNGVDDDENDCCNDDDARADELKRGRNIIGTWARKLFVGIGTNNPVAPGNSNPTTATVA